MHRIQEAGMIPHLEGPMEMPFVSLGLNHLRASYCTHGLFCTGLLITNFWVFEAIKRLKFRPLTALIANYFSERFSGEALMIKGCWNKYLSFFSFLLSFWLALSDYCQYQTGREKSRPDVDESWYGIWLYPICTGHTATCVEGIVRDRTIAH